MRIILLRDFETLGESGTQVEVKDGFARNYLIPKGIALKANKINLKSLKKLQNRKRTNSPCIEKF